MKYLKEYLPYLLILIGIILIRSFIITPVIVNGSSMYPTLKPNDFLLLEKYDTDYKRNDIVVVEYNKEKIVKRVIGLPGEKIVYKKGFLYINESKIFDRFSIMTEDFSLIEIGYDNIPKNCYLVLGDNRSNSIDSRIIGLVKKEEIIGKTNYRVFPFSKLGKIN